MSAETLREAARLMRQRSRFGAATEVAAWLDREAEQFERVGRHIRITRTYWASVPPSSGFSGGYWQAHTGNPYGELLRVENVAPTVDARALAVARAYLGDTP